MASSTLRDTLVQKPDAGAAARAAAPGAICRWSSERFGINIYPPLHTCKELWSLCMDKVTHLVYTGTPRIEAAEKCL